MNRRSFTAVFLLLLLGAPASAGQHLILVGGGDRPGPAMTRFVEWAGGKSARLLVISWATESPDISLADFREQMEPLGVASIEQAPTQPLTPEKRAAFLEQLAHATGVFFTGGDQVRIMDVLA